jgi:hypothetical protein
VRLWYALLVSFVACLATAIGSVYYTSHVQHQNDRRWCSLLVDIGDSQRAVPPKTESGKRFAAEIERLRREFGCRNQ